jgi:leucyl-tRNA synthetase
MVIKDGAKMSKSKGNVVDPDYLIQKYGADTARLFCLFASPPEKDLDWSDKGVEGAYRFIQRVWRLAMDCAEDFKGMPPAVIVDGNDRELTGLVHMIHKTIKRVTHDVERFHLNTAIAAIMELVNALYRFAEARREDEQALAVERGAVEQVLILLSPFCPHVTEELWKTMGNQGHLVDHPWPGYDEELVKEEVVTVVVQVNGKLRDKCEVERDTPEDRLKEIALDMENVKRHVAGQTIRKVIVVANKLVNVVCG